MMHFGNGDKPNTPLGDLTALPQTVLLDSGPYNTPPDLLAKLEDLTSLPQTL